MHPIFARPVRLALYIGVWIVFGILLAAVIAIGREATFVWALEFTLPLAVLLSFVAVSLWYLVQALPVAETPLTKFLGTWLSAGVVSLAVWLAVGFVWAEYLLPDDASMSNLPIRLAPLMVFAGIIGLTIAVLGHYLVAAFEHSRQAERRALESQVHAREAELKSLRAQLDPHFLFNSLNSVAALIGSDVASARRMCYLMSSFFRKSVSLGREESIALSAEVDLVETFLSIEAVRFGERLRTHFEVAEDVRNLSVPPLVLQPLVENAVHHGIAHLLEGGDIKISAQRRDNILQLSVENPCDPDRPASRGAGVGLNNVRARIDTLYGNRGSVEVAAQGSMFRVTVLMPVIQKAA
ncbi:MAG TPA: histidine kinase [Steroidobacteraceae bacterium]|nr:histidine kinase [Steroidobacteraceae bacterium]